MVSTLFSSSGKARSVDPSVIQDEYVRYPILIIPGFMSSGLYVEESNEYPNWKGERLWFNLQSLGAERLSRTTEKPWQALQKGIYELGSQPLASQPHLRRNDDAQVPSQPLVTEDSEEQTKIRSVWLRHMMLQDDLKSEHSNVKVRPIPGLEGVNYLYPSFLTNMVTYVFGPLIQFLVQEGGYVANVDLQAAPWDWRIPPCQLEARDQYFTKTLLQIEEIYHLCGSDKPIVVLGHSLGSKVAHYLLKFALQHKGQAWIDRHIYSYMPVSGTHIGVPKAIKQVVLVDHSCLDPFLTFEDEVRFGRSLGSAPWMFPTKLPKDHPPVAFVKRESVLEIAIAMPIQVAALVASRRLYDRPRCYQLQVALGIPSANHNVDRSRSSDGSRIRMISSQFLEVDPVGDADFGTETFVFCLESPIQTTKDLDASKLAVQLYLREPGVTKSRKAHWTHQGARLTRPLACIDWINRIIGFLLELICCVLDVAIFPLDVINEMTVDTSAILAVSDVISIRGARPNETKIETIDLTHIHDSHSSCFHAPLDKRHVTVQVQWTWKLYDESLPKEQLCSDIATLATTTESLLPQFELVDKVERSTYQGMSGHDFLYKEGPATQGYLRAIRALYDDDPYGPYDQSASDAPPVRRVHAIYGINLPTEISAFYRRNEGLHSTKMSLPRYQLDPSPGIVLQIHDSSITQDRYRVDGYLLKEFPSKDHKSGDGTVPYWCLSSVQSWKGSIDSLTVVELDQAEHRDILGSKVFQEEVLRYCRKRREIV